MTLDGYVADSAMTVAVGAVEAEAQRLLDVTRSRSRPAIAECREGRRLGDISHAVQEVVEAAGFSVVRSLVGHGVGQARCTRTRRSRTTVTPAAVRGWRRAWCSPSSRW